MNIDKQQAIVTALQTEFGWGPQNAEGAVRANFRCEYCDENLLCSINAYDSWQIDHIIPKKHSGDESLDNIALSCRTCNLFKHFYNPVGNNRSERIENAKSYIAKKRDEKQRELDKLKEIIDQ